MVSSLAFSFPGKAQGVSLPSAQSSGVRIPHRIRKRKTCGPGLALSRGAAPNSCLRSPSLTSSAALAEVWSCLGSSETWRSGSGYLLRPRTSLHNRLPALVSRKPPALVTGRLSWLPTCSQYVADFRRGLREVSTCLPGEPAWGSPRLAPADM